MNIKKRISTCQVLNYLIISRIKIDMYEKDVLDKWIRQIQTGQLNPEAIGLGSNKDAAIEKLRSEINKVSCKKAVVTVKQV